MRILLASDSFKGTFSCFECDDMLAAAARSVFGDVECISVPIADGGEGTVRAVLSATGGKLVSVVVSGPLWHPVQSFYGKIDSAHAVIEMAAASGLPLVPAGMRNPLNTTTYGTGELIKAAVKDGCRDILIGLGGSATNDGGIGCLRALGVKFFDNDGNELRGVGADLAHIVEIDVSGLRDTMQGVRISIMCDVSNPLCGENGATCVFGPQKGADAACVAGLERGMRNFKERIISQFGINPDTIAGSGAAGGLGCALAVFLNAKVMSGIETILRLSDFDRKAADSDFVVTGEGRVDSQSCHGKAICGIGTHCRMLGVPAVALAGSSGEGAEEIFKYGISSLFIASPSGDNSWQVPANARACYMAKAKEMFSIIESMMPLPGPANFLKNKP